VAAARQHSRTFSASGKGLNLRALILSPTLNDARGKVGIVLSNIMHGLPTEGKIDTAKSAIDVWIKELQR